MGLLCWNTGSFVNSSYKYRFSLGQRRHHSGIGEVGECPSHALRNREQGHLVFKSARNDSIGIAEPVQVLPEQSWRYPHPGYILSHMAITVEQRDYAFNPLLGGHQGINNDSG
ncbi:hypothetical protein ES708_26308 [subsurface metagenome]